MIFNVSCSTGCVITGYHHVAGPIYIQDICMIFNVPCSAGYVQGTIMWRVLVKYRICA